MTTVTINPNQKPTKETLRRLSELKDEDIVYDDDCPEMTTKMQKALACATAQKHRVVNTKVSNDTTIIERAFRHKTLEERAADYGGNLHLDGEFDFGEAVGREAGG